MNAVLNRNIKLLLGKTSSDNVVTELLEITPEIAKNILATKNLNNRTIMKATVDAYARDIADGEWKVTNQGIGFLKNGNLADGQHRLSAIVKANKPVLMQVTYGLEKDAINGIDQHKIRHAHDVLTMSGNYGTISKNDVAALKLCCNRPKLSVATLEKVYVEMSEFLEITKTILPYNSGFSSSPIQSAMMLAIYRCELVSIVKEFAEVLVHGISKKPEHEIIIRLRDVILKNGVGRGGSERKAFMKQVMWVIESFAKGEKRKRLVEPMDYAYKLIEVN